MADVLPLRFHHHGLALRREDTALPFLRALGYDIGPQIFDPEQGVHLRLCRSESAPSIELIVSARDDSPLSTILKNHSELIYHTCYETRSAEEAVEAVEALGLRIACVSPPKPAILFAGRRVSFYNVFGFGIVEFLETESP